MRILLKNAQGKVDFCANGFGAETMWAKLFQENAQAVGGVGNGS